MTIRRTSADAYREIEEKGLLTHLRLAVYQALYEHGPLTQGEFWSVHFSGYQRHSICPRIAELEKMGCVESVGERECRYSGVVSMLWDVTDSLPRPLEKTLEPTRVELINHLCSHIEMITDRIVSQTPVDWRNWYETAGRLLKACSKYRKKKNHD